MTSVSGPILVFSRTTGYRHESIPAGVDSIRDLGAVHGFAVETTEDPDVFTPQQLAGFRAVVFINTNGTVLDPPGRAAFETYIRTGGGYVGVHSAAATEYDWPFYGELIGAYFDRHPHVQPGRVMVIDRTHPATAHLPPVWECVDEWYDFRSTPHPSARILMTLDESSYTGGGMGPNHPLAWCREFAGGRTFYTAIGHTIEAYAQPAVRAHLLGGIRYAAGSARMAGVSRHG
jgi:type 1 glutamine amidotransferase